MNVPRSSRTRKTALGLVLALLASVAGLALAAAPASAESFRYWGYYHLADSEWEFATTGNAQFTPEDGSVEGYRFAVSAPDVPRMPRSTATFEQICGETPVGEGQKRVGVMIDFGRDADAVEGATPPDPKSACAVVPDAATGADVLAKIAELRMEGEFFCAIDGYPAAGCGDPVADAAITPEMAAADEPIDFPALVNAEGQTSDEVADSAQEAAEEAAVDSDSVPTWVWALVAVAVLAALIGLIAQRSRANRSDN